MKRIRQEEGRHPRKRMMRAAKLIVIFFIAVFFLEIWAVTRLSTYGEKIQQIKNDRASLELENQVLENTIAQNSSMMAIEGGARVFGFGQSKNIEYLKPANLASAQ